MAGETNEGKDRKLDEKTDELLLSLFNALSDYDNKNEHNKEKLKKYLIDQSIMNAYKDATNQGAFNAVWYKICGFEEDKEKYISKIPPEGWEKINNKKSKEKRDKALDDAAKKEFKKEKYPDGLKESAIDTMEKYLKTIPSLDDANYTYDKWHRDLCEDLMKLYKEYELDEAFTYGNVQKWVNMAVKYLYVYASLIDRMKEFNGDANPFKNILKQKRNLHVPIDRYVIKAVFNYNTRKDLSEKLFEQKRTSNYNYANCEGKLCFKQDKQGNITELCKKTKDSDYTLTWSNIKSYKDYMTIQTEIKDNIKNKMFPIEWENKVWLQMAMKP